MHINCIRNTFARRLFSLSDIGDCVCRNSQKQIIGVVKDFHFESLYNRVGPAFLEYIPTSESLLVRIRSSQRQSAIAGLDKLYKSFNEGVPFEFRFLDDEYNAMYASEEKIAVLSRYFAGVAIIISCLGLFGLTAFMAQKRQKEIGIRKVVGATVNNITMMLSADFLKLVAIALVIACPIGWWAMQSWLKGFAYRINLGAVVFVIAAAAVLVVTIATVSFQAIRAALKNPVTSLRTE